MWRGSAIVLSVLLAQWAAGCGQGADTTPATAVAPPPFKPVADIQQLMTMVIEPAAEVVWDSVGTIITMEGTEEIYPATDEEWAAVQNGAMVLAESGNLLMIGDRAQGEGPWMIMSQAMVDAGVAALEAANARDADAIFALGERIYDSCETCHVLYWYEDDPSIIR